MIATCLTDRNVEWFKLGKVIVGTNDDRFYIKVMGNLENFHHC